MSAAGDMRTPALPRAWMTGDWRLAVRSWCVGRRAPHPQIITVRPSPFRPCGGTREDDAKPRVRWAARGFVLVTPYSRASRVSVHDARPGIQGHKRARAHTTHVLRTKLWVPGRARGRMQRAAMLPLGSRLPGMTQRWDDTESAGRRRATRCRHPRACRTAVRLRSEGWNRVLFVLAFEFSWAGWTRYHPHLRSRTPRRCQCARLRRGCAAGRDLPRQ